MTQIFVLLVSQAYCLGNEVESVEREEKSIEGVSKLIRPTCRMAAARRIFYASVSYVCVTLCQGGMERKRENKHVNNVELKKHTNGSMSDSKIEPSMAV
jgi:hypothetical protein